MQVIFRSGINNSAEPPEVLAVYMGVKDAENVIGD